MGGSKKQTIGYKYYLGLHLILSLGPIDKIRAIYADKKEIWSGDVGDGTISIDAENIFGGEEKEGGISGIADIQLGKPDQTVNSYLAEKLIDLVPAFRGVVSFIGRQLYVGTQTYLKSLGFLASRINVRQADGIEQWYLEKAEIRSNPEDTDNRVSVVVSTKTIVKASPDGINWPYATTIPPDYPILQILLSEDKKSFYAITTTKVLQTVDGINWVQLVDLTAVAAGGLNSGTFVFWKGYYWLVRGAHGISRSLDCITWQHTNAGGSGSISKLYPAGERMLAESNATSNILYIETPDDYTSWSSGASKPIFNGFTNSVWVDGILKISAYDFTISGDRKAVVWSTVDGSSFSKDATEEISGEFWDITYGLNRYVAITRLGQIAVKLGSDIWRLRTDDFSFDTQTTYIDFFDNKFWILRNDNSGGSTTTGYVYYSATADNGSWIESLTGLQEDYKFAGGALIGEGIKTGDMNPAHIIRECLTDPDWGLGYQDDDIDDVSFTLAADTLYNERFGMSLLWTRQTTVEDFIKEIVKHIDASVFVDRKTGKFKLVLIRDDFETDDLITLDASNIERISDFNRSTFGELVNSITVQYWDSSLKANSSVTVQDIALAQMQGDTINTTQSYSGLTTKELAARVAQRDLKTVSTPSVSCTIYTNRIAADLEPGSPFKLTWPDFKCDELVMRVTSIAYGDGLRNRIRLTCTQDVYKLPEASLVLPEMPAWVDPSTAPVPATLRKPFEVPYLEAVQRQGQTAVDAVILTEPGVGYVGTAAGRPSSASINANLYTNSGGGFLYAALFDFCPTATLDIDIDYLDTSFNISNSEDLELVDDGSWFQIDEEILVKVSLVGTLLTVKRGALDTVPSKHLANSILYFWDEFSGIDPTEYVDGESVDLKITPKTGLGELALVDAPTDVVDVVGRLARPYPPANVKIDGNYFPPSAEGTVGISWVHRDRKLQTGSTLVGFTDPTIGPEAGTTYNTKIINALTDTVLASESDIVGNTSVLITDYVGQALIEIESVRDSINSYQKYSIPISIVNNDSLITEDEELLLFEDSESIEIETYVAAFGSVFTQIEAADVRDGNRQVAFFYWAGYPPGWSPDWDCVFSVNINRRGLTEGAPSLWSIGSKVTGASVDPLTESEVDQGTIDGGVGADITDIGLNEAASDASVDLYGQQRTAGPFPSDWCDDFDSFGASFQWAIAFPVGVPVTYRFNPGIPSSAGLGEIQFFASSVSGTMGSTNPANERYYHDATVDFICSLGSGFLDKVEVARSQVTLVRFEGAIVIGAEYKITLDATSFSYIVISGDDETDIANALIALIDADADYEAELQVGSYVYVKITGLPTVAFTVTAVVI